MFIRLTSTDGHPTLINTDKIQEVSESPIPGRPGRLVGGLHGIICYVDESVDEIQALLDGAATKMRPIQMSAEESSAWRERAKAAEARLAEMEPRLAELENEASNWATEPVYRTW